MRFFITVFTITALFILPPTRAEPPIELGTVTWIRDLETGLNKAKKSEKPVFLLFQESPG